MPGDKASNAEIEIYVHQIARLMIKGYMRREDILEYIKKMNEEYYRLADPKYRQRTGLTQAKLNWLPIEKEISMLDNYIKRATDVIHNAVSLDINQRKSMILAQFYDLYQLARRKDQTMIASSILRNIMYLEGLGGVNVKVFNFDPSKFDVDLEEKDYEDYKKTMERIIGTKELPPRLQAKFFKDHRDIEDAQVEAAPEKGKANVDDHREVLSDSEEE